MRERKELCREE